ncbi:transcription factor Sp3-like [Toxorhynchites rutilus septentrionalis]|uniref:transcription factor Sp3-like n=1 Tax=Toxorhynchites rutilus septentrionalis TaxID=329112 RepID=UPI002478BDCB|nr:transcription factor Sp3-like [Toxorhynchites rutilus septentrionalis]
MLPELSSSICTDFLLQLGDTDLADAECSYVGSFDENLFDPFNDTANESGTGPINVSTATENFIDIWANEQKCDGLQLLKDMDDQAPSKMIEPRYQTSQLTANDNFNANYSVPKVLDGVQITASSSATTDLLQHRVNDPSAAVNPGEQQAAHDPFTSGITCHKAESMAEGLQMYPTVNLPQQECSADVSGLVSAAQNAAFPYQQPAGEQEQYPQATTNNQDTLYQNNRIMNLGIENETIQSHTHPIVQFPQQAVSSTPDVAFPNLLELVDLWTSINNEAMPVVVESSPHIAQLQNQPLVQLPQQVNTTKALRLARKKPNPASLNQQSPVGIMVQNAQPIAENAGLAPNLMLPSQLLPVKQIYSPTITSPKVESGNDAGLQQLSSSIPIVQSPDSPDIDGNILQLEVPQVVLRLEIVKSADQWVVNTVDTPETIPAAQDCSSNSANETLICCCENENSSTETTGGNPDHDEYVELHKSYEVSSRKFKISEFYKTHWMNAPRVNEDLPLVPVGVTKILTETSTKKRKVINLFPTFLECEFCGKLCTSQAGLTQHKNHIHSEIPRPFKCDTCGKTFITQLVLEEHQHSHSDEYKPYGCEWCYNRFCFVKDLARHIEKHTTSSFVCSVEGCDKGFARADHLRSHIQSHITRRQLRVTNGRLPKCARNELDDDEEISM